MFQKIGICGIGNMGYAIGKGIAASGLLGRGGLLLYNIHNEKAIKAANEFGPVASVAAEVTAMAAEADVFILAVKPNTVPSVLTAIAPVFKEGSILLSVAAGVDMKTMAFYLPAKTKIVRAMPNTPVIVGAGMTSLTPNNEVRPEETDDIIEIFRSFGRAEIVEEHLIDAVVGVSGSSPAYTYMFIEALADGAVRAGLARAEAYTFAAQTVMGAAKMVLETGLHPGKLKDAVCSPGGTTIEAVRTLEKNGFRTAVMEAVITAAEKNHRMSREK